MSRRRKGRQATRRWSLKRVSFLKRLAGGGRAGERARLRGLRRKRTTISPSPHSSLSLSLSLLDETRTRLVLSWSCEGALTVPANSGCCRSLQFASFSRRQVFSSIPTAPLSLSLFVLHRFPFVSARRARQRRPVRSYCRRACR